MTKLSMTYSLAEQSFSWTRSIGLLNLSMGMLEHVARRPEVSKVTLLSNETFKNALNLPNSVETRIHNEANGRGLSRMFWDQWKIYSAALAAGNEWLFMPKGFVSFMRRCPVKLTAYVPDVMFDYYERIYPGKFSKLEAIYLKQSIKAALRQCRVIFTCSEFTNSELTRVALEWGITPPPLVAIGTGFTRKLKLDVPKDERIVVLASPFAHKRTDLALKYLERWYKETKFAGRVDWVGGFEKGVSLPNLPNWRLHQRVPEKDFREMVARAKALIYFTEYEGFGMPPVESIIAGTCSVYSDIPCTFEVMQGMGAPFKNENYESFATSLEEAMKTSPEQLEAWTDKLLERHNWDVGAEKIVNALLSAA